MKAATMRATTVAVFLAISACQRTGVAWSATSTGMLFGRTHAPRCPRMSMALSGGGGPAFSKGEEPEEGDKKGYSIVRVLSAGAVKGVKGVKPRVVRIDDALRELDPRAYPTPSAAKKEIRKGSILVNGARARIDSNIYLGSDRITVQGRTSTTFKALGSAPFPIKVVYEDDHIAVVHKPPGVCTHPPPKSGKESRMTMSVAVQYFISPAPAGTERILWRPSIVHRLDKLTEGLQLVAKTKSANVEMQKQFMNRLVKKRYIAVVQGSPSEDEGTIDLDIGGKSAVSKWRVVSRGQNAALPGSNFTTLELSPLTGRTHQLRVHCSAGLGMPIVGDRAYRGTDTGHGLLLAAEGISFTHPHTGQNASFQLGEPQRFVDFRHGIGSTAALGSDSDEETEEEGLSEVVEA